MSYGGETVSQYVYFKDRAGTAIDPDITEAKVYDPQGVYVATITLTPTGEVGKYEANYNIPLEATAGDWCISVKAQKGSYKEIEKVWFTVEKV